MEVEEGHNFFMKLDLMFANKMEDPGMTHHYVISKSAQDGALQDESYTQVLQKGYSWEKWVWMKLEYRRKEKSL